MAKRKASDLAGLSPEDQTTVRDALRAGGAFVRGTLMAGGKTLGEGLPVRQSAGVYLVSGPVEGDVEVDGVRVEVFGFPTEDQPEPEPVATIDVPSTKARKPVGGIGWATFAGDLAPDAVAAADGPGESVAVPAPAPEATQETSTS